MREALTQRCKDGLLLCRRSSNATSFLKVSLARDEHGESEAPSCCKARVLPPRKGLISSRTRLKTRSSVPSAPPCTNTNFTPCDLPSEGHTLFGPQHLPRHQIEIWTAFHGCRVKSSVFPAGTHTFIKHAPSPIINFVPRALVMTSRQSFSTI